MLKRFATCLVAAVLFQSPALAADRVFLPTSLAVKIGEMIAADEGYSLKHESRYFLDLITDHDGRPRYPGRVTIAFYWDSELISVVSINPETGSMIDPGRCIVYSYPDIVSLQKRLWPTAHRDLNADSDSSGCSKLILAGQPRQH